MMCFHVFTFVIFLLWPFITFALDTFGFQQKCLNSGVWDESYSECDCIPGFGSANCSTPLCGSLANENVHRPFKREEKPCKCDDGWGGITCNMCKNDRACDGVLLSGVPSLCYKEGILRRKNYQQCDVKNKKILDQLHPNTPQVTFSCDNSTSTCNFQFWIEEVESFYCSLSSCKFSHEKDGKSLGTLYECEKAECACIPDRQLCGKDGLVDLSDFLEHEITGPATFQCNSNAKEKGKSCSFEEKAMNQVISDIFGDTAIYMNCQSSECIYPSDLPSESSKFNHSANLFFVIVLILIGILSLITFCLLKQVGKVKILSWTASTDHENNDGQHDKRVSLAFKNLSYTVNSTNMKVLSECSGLAKSGEVLAILGPSGAGKSTLLDILALKRKLGTVSGQIACNGNQISASTMKKISGFVNQDDLLLPTLTVFESVLFSANLRLPMNMPFEEKIHRVQSVLDDLDISDIKDRLIGDIYRRGVSGGERKRVAIACELVADPAILFLDEPTSGLDSFHANSIMSCVKKLAQKQGTTVVVTIHQPASKIISLFDNILLLSKGRCIFFGSKERASEYFESLSFRCPDGYNIAEFLIDICEQASGVLSRQSSRSQSSRDASPDELRKIFQSTTLNFELMKSIDAAVDHAHLSSPIGDYYQERVSIAKAWFQIQALSSRSLKNIYRNPILLVNHYAVAILIALICGILFNNVPNDISGFQNRLGLMFFVLALFGFGTLTSLHTISEERPVLMRERAAGFYESWSFFLTMIFFDILLLRVVPPLILSAILYPMVGLVPAWSECLRFALILVLFNACAASICLCIGILIRDSRQANFVGSIYMLFSLLFAGLLLNYNIIPKPFKWLQLFSIFHYALEALLVNEVRFLTLTDHRYGLKIDVPGAAILSSFGFNTRAINKDIFSLFAILGVSLFLGMIILHIKVRERR